MKDNFCPNCGKPTFNKAGSTKLVCSSCEFEFWNNPKATVAVLILKDSKLLFSKRGIDPRKGQYDFPGGFIEYGESPYEACRRELEEETGLGIDPKHLKLFEAYGAEYLPGTSVVDMLFILRVFEGEPKPADDSAALEWKPLDFVNSDQFVDYYPGLLSKLEAFLSE